MKRLLVVISLVVLCLLSSALWATPSTLPTLLDLFPNFTEAQFESLKNGEILDASTSSGEKISDITPQNTQATALATKADNLESGFAVSSVSFIPYPENFAKLSAEEREVTLYNILRSYSTQKGLIYISYTAGNKPTTLFKDSYLISDPNDKNSKMPDPVSTKVPERYSCYAYQKDNRFGGNVYLVDYTIKNGDFLMDVSNYTGLKYMGFSCLDKNALHMYLEVIEAEEGFVLFTHVAVKDQEPAVKVLFITVNLPSAFLRRTTALTNWFTDRVNSL